MRLESLALGIPVGIMFAQMLKLGIWLVYKIDCGAFVVRECVVEQRRGKIIPGEMRNAACFPRLTSKLIRVKL